MDKTTDKVLSGVICMSDIPYRSAGEINEENIAKYSWIIDKQWLRNRIQTIFDQMDEKYDIALGREKQALYFLNDFYIRFL